jgi:diaminopimelate decarboxylase
LRARVEHFQAAFKDAGARLFFATMANDRPQLLRTLAAAGLGACVNSIPHLQLARAVGFPDGRLQFTSTGISLWDLQALHDARVQVNLDSLAQLDAWLRVGAKHAGIRVNAAALTGRRPGDRIGIEPRQLEAALELAARRGGRVTGLHVYVGTNFQQSDEMLPTIEQFFKVAESLPDLEYVNIGGGIGIDYGHSGRPFDVERFGHALSVHIRRLCGKHGRIIELIVEPGRGLSAPVGTFITSVTDVKDLHGQRYAAVDGSIAVFPRPLLHPETPHRIRALTSARDLGLQPTIVVGRTTYSRDILGRAELPGTLETGSLLAFDDAGAYCASMATRFLGQEEPAEVFLRRSDAAFDVKVASRSL